MTEQLTTDTLLLLGIVFSLAILLGSLYYVQKRKNKEGFEEVVDQVETTSNADYAELVGEKQALLEKTKLKNAATKEAFHYLGNGCFIQSIDDVDHAKYIKIYVDEENKVEFYTQPNYSIAGTYHNDCYIKYFDGTPYVSFLLLKTLYLLDNESMWLKVLAPVEYIDELGYNFLEFLTLSLPERHLDDKWFDDTSSSTSNRSYFKGLTAAEILTVPNSKG